MSVPRQLILAIRGNGSNTWKGLRSPIASRYLTSAATRSNVKVWRSCFARVSYNYGNRHTYTSWTWDWVNLLRAPAKEKTKQRRRWRIPKPTGDDIALYVIVMALFIAQDYYYPQWHNYQVVAKESHSTAISIITIRYQGFSFDFLVDRAERQGKSLERIWKGGFG